MEFSDLKLIDELLLDVKIALGPAATWQQVEEFSAITRLAMKRLHDAYIADDPGLKVGITLGLARHLGLYP